MGTFARLVAFTILFGLALSQPLANEGGAGGGGGGGDGGGEYWNTYLQHHPEAIEPLAIGRSRPRRIHSAGRARPTAVAARERVQAPRRFAQRKRAASWTQVAQRARPPAQAPAQERRIVAGEVLVQPRPNVSGAAIDRLAEQHGLTRIASEELALLGPLHRFRIPDGRSVSSVVRRLSGDRRVAIAQANFAFELQQATAPQGAQYALDKLRVTDAHRISKGGGVLIAVIDSAVDRDHPDLKDAVADRLEVVDGAARPHAHGTAVAGAIAARGQLTGVAPAGQVLAITAFDEARRGANAGGSSWTVLRAIDEAYRRKVKLVNLSFAGPRDGLLAKMLKRARESGMIFIAAAGNAGDARPLYPAADANVIAVSATDPADRIYASASRGKHIAVAAPGVDVLVLSTDAAYGLSSGTSIAAAHVTGVVALLLERNPGLQVQEIRAILTSTARPFASDPGERAAGVGIPDAHRAVDAATPQRVSHRGAD